MQRGIDREQVGDMLIVERQSIPRCCRGLNVRWWAEVVDGFNCGENTVFGQDFNTQE